MALSERHLDSLLDDTSSALDVLATLSESFKKVELQTTAFQAQCEDLLAEQKRLRDLADEVGTDLQYYALLEPLTRRINGPGASRLVRSGDDFLEMLTNLNTCIDFMDQHVSSALRLAFLSHLLRFFVHLHKARLLPHSSESPSRRPALPQSSLFDRSKSDFVSSTARVQR